MVESLQSTLAIPGQEFIATEYGRRLLVGSVVPEGLGENELLRVIKALGKHPDEYPDILEKYEGAGAGTMSELYQVGDGVGSLVLKVSMPDSTVGISTEERPLAPERLVTQMRLMNALGKHFEKSAGGSIITPPHHFALQIDDAHALTVMDFMNGWTDLRDWVGFQRFGGAYENAVIEQVSDRIMLAVMDTPFEDAIDDLFVPPEGEDGSWDFRADNVLVPFKTYYDEFEEAQLCLIDQPPPWKIEEALFAISAYEALGYRPEYLS